MFLFIQSCFDSTSKNLFKIHFFHYYICDSENTFRIFKFCTMVKVFIYRENFSFVTNTFFFCVFPFTFTRKMIYYLTVRFCAKRTVQYYFFISLHHLLDVYINKYLKLCIAPCFTLFWKRIIPWAIYGEGEEKVTVCLCREKCLTFDKKQTILNNCTTNQKYI